METVSLTQLTSNLHILVKDSGPSDMPLLRGTLQSRLACSRRIDSVEQVESNVANERSEGKKLRGDWGGSLPTDIAPFATSRASYFKVAEHGFAGGQQ